MTRTTEHGAEDEQPNVLPPPLAAILRPELPSLADEIITAIRDKIPEYARPIDGPYGQIMRTGVEQALTSFVDLVADPATSRADRDGVARMLGRHEAEEGRSLDSLQAAYRVGAQVAWHRAMEVGRDASLSSSVMSTLADAVFGYMNDLATLSFEGYRELKARSAGEQQAARRRLLQLILDRDDPVPLRALADLAETACWPLPEEVIAVAVTQAASADGAPEPFGDHEILASLDDPQPHLLLPADSGALRWEALQPGLLAGGAPPSGWLSRSRTRPIRCAGPGRPSPWPNPAPSKPARPCTARITWSRSGCCPTAHWLTR